MRLSATDKRMLGGEKGPACELAMNILSDLGSLYGARRMIPITQVHIDMTLYMVDAGVEFVEHMADLGARFSVPTQLNPAAIDLMRPEKLRVPRGLLEKSRRLENAYLKMGAMPTWTCAPYQQGLIPSFGEQVAWGESNAVAFVNSVIGARTERYADLVDVCAAIAGRVPELGLHIDANRKAERLIELKGVPDDAFQDSKIFAVLGFVFGEIAGDRVAALKGMPEWIARDDLKAFSAAAASSGAVGLFHIIGATPEAPDEKTCLKGEGRCPISIITPDIIDDAAARLDQGNCSVPDLITLGCPHYSVEEFRILDRLLDSREITAGIEFWVFTSRKTYTAIESSDLLKRIESCGVKVFTDGCSLQYPKESWEFRCAMSDSAKYANYCFSQTGHDVIFGGVRDCVETAVAGKLRRTPLWK